MVNTNTDLHKNRCPLSPPYSKNLKPGFPFLTELDTSDITFKATFSLGRTAC